MQKPKKEKLIQQDPQVAFYDKKLGVRCPTSRSTGLFVFPPDCQFFVNCVDGTAYVQQCAPGTAFNPKTLECDYRHKVKCYSTDYSDPNALPHDSARLGNSFVRFPGEGRANTFQGGESVS